MASTSAKANAGRALDRSASPAKLLIGLVALVLSCSRLVDLDGLHVDDAAGGVAGEEPRAGAEGRGGSDASGKNAGGADAIGSAGAAGTSEDWFGTGQDGSLKVVGTQVPNRFAVLAAAASAGDRSLTVARNPDPVWLVADRLILLWRPHGETSSGGETTLALSTDVGRYALLRVASRDGDQIKLATPVPFDLPGGAESQLVLVPEYTTLDVPNGAALSTAPWNGAFGGVLAIVADEAHIDGALSVDGLGGRGGASGQSGYSHCADPNGTAEFGYSGKGEGLDGSRFGNAQAGGPLNYLNGGGGAPCATGGGAGGGHLGGGGRGGHEFYDTGNVWASGGAALMYSPSERVLFGGGGGGGQGNGSLATAGAAGGGVVLIWTRAMTGGGVLSAAGAIAKNGAGDASEAAGSGGGGAGGAVIVHSLGQIACASARAPGGAGGTSATDAGPVKFGSGGGGGGGLVALFGSDVTCATDVTGGAHGVMQLGTPASLLAHDGLAGAAFTAK